MEDYVKIRRLRKERGYSQSYVAKKLNISQRAYSKIELNETHLNWDKINRIAEILDVDVLKLVDTNRKGQQEWDGLKNNIDLLTDLINRYEQRIDQLEKKVKLLEAFKAQHEGIKKTVHSYH